MNKYISSFLVLVLVVSVGAAGYFYMQYSDAQKKLMVAQSKTGTSNAAADARVLAQVEKLIELPKDESPTLATVSDKSKLSSQNFFRNAQNGDRLIIFVKSKKVILYRPTENKIIEVGTISVSQNTSTGSPTPTVKK